MSQRQRHAATPSAPSARPAPQQPRSSPAHPGGRVIGAAARTRPVAAPARTSPAQSAAPTPPPGDRIVEVKLASDHPLVGDLESLLGELVVLYEQLKSMSAMHLDAIKDADARKLAACVRQENSLVQQVAEVEKKRIRVVGQLAEQLGSPRKHETTMGWLARRVDGPRAAAMERTAERLKALMGEVNQINAVARGAAEHLAKHMEGVMHEIARGMNHAKVYSRSGRVQAGARVTSGLDLSS